mmetsp:Transcript_7288/g.18952  ORF Transcript_7288/g.18952 Transcript_7288/m.18952 type:complete len:206 (-) Transcript_7288:620-1237(-)
MGTVRKGGFNCITHSHILRRHHATTPPRQLVTIHHLPLSLHPPPALRPPASSGPSPGNQPSIGYWRGEGRGVKTESKQTCITTHGGRESARWRSPIFSNLPNTLRMNQVYTSSCLIFGSARAFVNFTRRQVRQCEVQERKRPSSKIWCSLCCAAYCCVILSSFLIRLATMLLYFCISVRLQSALTSLHPRSRCPTPDTHVTNIQA